ncbi:MAG TPA: cyclophilin-like fold protein [Chitinophagaceae bacterium]|nr:cyclophilin-like fold protein [Chitinophagaceae bacterium]
MKPLLLLVFCTFSLFIGCASSDKNDPAPAAVNNSNNNADSPGTKMRIKVGNHTFIATLYDNATAAAFKAMLPMTVNMVDLNGNEKYVDLSRDLPTNASNPGTIKTGDLMLYGSNTLVLFYKTFSISYSYTTLGRIDDSARLAEALGSGNVKIALELE